ncbi:hypothetical protein [Streptomyces sp. NPDC089919]|uniref:hypothetical protein n=1 Tax=Streptomyces sp. NPDC089919 TaxID=3155188 RepID=UPI00343F7B21
MRGDETQRAQAPGAESRERKGPRHAAPRKSLLTKLQIPVGKTMALAAMPTAVFVGMGIAPKLALAEDKDIPFAPGPCVTRSDEPPLTDAPEDGSKDTSKDKDKSKDTSEDKSKDTSGDKGKSGKKPGSKDEAEDKAGTGDKDKSGGVPTSTGPAPAKKTTAPRRDTEDAITALPGASGVGGTVQGLLGGLTKTAGATERAIREAALKSGATVTELSDAVKKTVTQPKNETGEQRGTDADGTGKATSTTKSDKADKADKTEKSGKSADGKKSGEGEKSDEDKASKDEKDAKDAKTPDGKQPFPCPTHDAKALADAELETGIPLLPDEPWYLDSSLLTLSGLDYHGIVEVKTAGGKIKKVLKFTASSVDIKDLYQTIGTSGQVTHLHSRKGSTSTIRGGTVTMYTEELKGNLFGLIPITFSPDTPPPLNVPFAFFTNAKVRQAGQFGGNLTVPGLHNYIGPAE